MRVFFWLWVGAYEGKSGVVVAQNLEQAQKMAEAEMIPVLGYAPYLTLKEVSLEQGVSVAEDFCFENYEL
jgi:hypothetical protein